jgi:hypothetical protein
MQVVGKTRGPYSAEFPVGTVVQIANQKCLQEFRRTWQFHHPLFAEQLEHAGRKVRVISVGYYHGGDELYELAGVSGLWHEACVSAISPTQE